MNPVIKLKKILKFSDAVERREKKHPGPFTKEEWQEALREKRHEADNEICSSDCDVCRFTEGSIGCIEQLRLRQSELLDEAVVSYCASMEMDDIIMEKELRFEKIAMGCDPR